LVTHRFQEGRKRLFLGVTLLVIGCRMPDAGCRMQDAGCRMQEAFGVGREFLFLVEPTKPGRFWWPGFFPFCTRF